MKYILIIGDGMADDAVPELGDRTPLEYAKTPAMDALASAGRLGSALTIPEGLPAGSDTAILSIFGCDPRTCYGGRAPLEAAASGISLSLGDVAYRCNMITVEDGNKAFERKKILSHSAGSIDGDVSDALVSDLFKAPGFREAAKAARIKVYPGNSFRHIAVQKAPPHEPYEDQAGLCVALTPPHDHIGEPVGKLLPKGNGDAEILANLMRTAHSILDNHPINKERREEGLMPANGIWFWAEGVATSLPNFKKTYGKTGAVISAVALCQGIGMLMGLSKIVVPGATGDLYTNYEGKVDAAFTALMSKDFAAVHVEAPDECSHDGNREGKLQAIEWVDSRIAAPLVSRLRDKCIDFRMLVISDHKTLLSTRGHAGGAVPFVIYDSRADLGTGLSFCERDAEKGVFVGDGTELMNMLFNDADGMLLK